MIEIFHIAGLAAFAFAAAHWSKVGWVNVSARIGYVGLTAWAAVVVAMDYVQ